VGPSALGNAFGGTRLSLEKAGGKSTRALPWTRLRLVQGCSGLSEKNLAYGLSSCVGSGVPTSWARHKTGLYPTFPRASRWRATAGLPTQKAGFAQPEKGVQGKEPLSPGILSPISHGRNGVPPKAHINVAGHDPRKKRNGTEVPFLFQAFSRTCSPAPQAGRSGGCRPRGRGRSCGGGPP